MTICLEEIPRDLHGNSYNMGINNCHGLIWEGKTDTNFATQYTWIHDNKYTRGKNIVS